MRRRTNPHVEVTQGRRAVLAAGLDTLCAQDSFEHAPRNVDEGAEIVPRRAENRPAEAPKWPSGGVPRTLGTQVGPKLAQVGPKLAKLSPKWPEVGPKLAQVGPKLALSWP